MSPPTPYRLTAPVLATQITTEDVYRDAPSPYGPQVPGHVFYCGLIAHDMPPFQAHVVTDDGLIPLEAGDWVVYSPDRGAVAVQTDDTFRRYYRPEAAADESYDPVFADATEDRT